MTTDSSTYNFRPFHASVNVATLLKEPVGATRDYDIRELAEEGDASPVTGRVGLTHSARGVLVRTDLVHRIDTVCSRCVKPIDCDVTVKIDEEFLPSIDINSGLPVKAPRDCSSFLIDANHILDLGEAVRQYTMLALPMKPLCRPDCAGYCPNCGADLNQGKCECSEKTIDPRWAKLMALKRKPSLAAPRKRSTTTGGRKKTNGTATKA